VESLFRKWIEKSVNGSSPVDKTSEVSKTSEVY
jgi:hypothetical protein